MDTLWIGVDPRPDRTRVLVMAGPEQVLLKAHLSPRPSSRLALGALAEALCLWQGARARVAIVAAPPDPCSPLGRFAEEPFGIAHGALVEVEVVDALRPPRRNDGLTGMGRFDDLQQLLRFEAMR